MSEAEGFSDRTGPWLDRGGRGRGKPSKVKHMLVTNTSMVPGFDRLILAL